MTLTTRLAVVLVTTAILAAGCGGSASRGGERAGKARSIASSTAVVCAPHMRLTVVRRVRVGSGAGALTVQGHMVWVARAAAGTVTRLFGSRPLVLHPGGDPVSLALGYGKLWMALRDGNQVAGINLHTLGAIPGASLSVPVSVVVGRAGVWALSLDAGALYQLDPRTGAPSSPIYAPVADPIDMVPSGQDLWVLGAQNGGLSPVNAALQRIVRTGFDDAGRSVSGLSASDRTLWLGEPGRHDLLRVEAATVDVHEIPAPYGLRPSSTAVGACGEWVGDAGGKIALIDAVTGAPLSPAVPLGHSIAAMAATGNGVWVSDPVDGTVVRVRAQPAR